MLWEFPGGPGVKDSALSPLWLRLLLWLGFDPWPRNFGMLQAQPGKQKTKQTNKQKNNCSSYISSWSNLGGFLEEVRLVLDLTG